MKKILKYLYILPITIIFIDQLAKFFVVKNIPAYDFIPLIRSVLSVTKIYNSGIILGLYFQNNNLITIISRKKFRSRFAMRFIYMEYKHRGRILK